MKQKERKTIAEAIERQLQRITRALLIVKELETRSKKEPISHYQFALIFAGLQQKGRACAELQTAFQERSTLLSYLKMDPRFDSLRAEVRYGDLLIRMGLPQ